MKLYRPSAPFQMIEPHGEAISVETSGKVLVLPTGNADLLPRFNEYTLNSNRLTVAESPFGGMKGSASPDFSPGTLYTPTDGIYLQDTSGTNSTKTLTAGKLKELSLLSVDTQAHSITEEFIVANTATSNNPTVLDDGTSATNWATSTVGTGSISVVSGQISLAGTSSTGSPNYFTMSKTVSLNLTNYNFITFTITSNVTGELYFGLKTNTYSKLWSGSRFPITANTPTVYVLPLDAPQGTTGQLPNLVQAGWAKNNITSIIMGLQNIGSGVSITASCDNIQADVARSAYVELQTPNNLADTSIQLYTHNSTAYQLCRVSKLDSTWSDVSTTPANCTLADGTKFDDVYGSTLGRAIFPKGVSGQTVTGSSGTMQYSANKGTRNRIGFMVQLPPADGRTNFSKIRLKTVLYYSDINKATNILPDISGNANHGTMDRVGIVADNLGNPYKALKFPGFGYVDCGNAASLQITGDLTIVTTVKFSSPPSNAYGIISKYRNQTGYVNQRGYALNINSSGRFTTTVSKDGLGSEGVSSNTIATTINFADGNWHRVVVIFKPSTSLKLYVDGIERASSATNIISSIYNTPTNLWLGAYLDLSDYTYFSSGYQANTILYSRSWTTEEVTADYNNQPVSSTGLVAQWQPKEVSHMGATTYDFSNDTSASTGLQNVVKPWLALYDPANNYLDFYLFTHRSKNLSYKRDESGNIYELTLYPGNGLIYWGRITYPNLTLDSDSNLIPNCLEASVEGSLAKFLQAYGMVIQ